MELKIIVNNTELDLSSDKFEINLTSFNPLTNADATRKYTSSIKLERSTNNDAVFFAYRYPAFAPRETLSADVYVGGIFVESFRCVVVVEEDGYSINLVSKTNSITNQKRDVVLSNDATMPYYVGINNLNMDMRYFVDIKKMLAFLYPGITLNPSIQIPDPIIKTKSEYLTEYQNKRYDVIFRTYRSSKYYGEGNRIIFDNSALMKHFDRPDASRVATFESQNSYITFDVRDGFPHPGSPAVKMYINGDEYLLQFKDAAAYDVNYSIPNFTVSYDSANPLEMFITTDRGNFRFDTSNFKPLLKTISGDQTILISNECDVSSNIDFLKSYATMTGSYISSSSGNIVVKPFVVNNVLDWSDKFVSLSSIKTSDGSAQKKNMKFGYITTLLFNNHVSVDEFSDLTINLTMNFTANEASTGIIAANPVNQILEFQEYFDKLSYWNQIKSEYQRFDECVEYEIEAILSIMDILDFEQSYPVYIDQLHTRCYVLSISGWSSLDGNCKVKLLKLK